MKISVIIPIYNEEKYIGKCLKSLSNQSYKKYEIIVVDDGSSDHSVKISKSYKTKIIKKDHLGAGAARNAGAKIAKGDILVFVDADMVVSKNFLKKLTLPIVKKKSKGTFTLNEKVSNFENPWARCWNYEYTRQITDSRIPSNYPLKSNVFRAILKSEFMSVNGYDEIGYGEDSTLSKKLGYKSTSTQALVYHANPSNLVEVMDQAKWVATRPYKMGEVGRLVALIRASFPVSFIISMIGVIRYQSLFYQVFKIIYDMGIFMGIIRYWTTRSYAQ